MKTRPGPLFYGGKSGIPRQRKAGVVAHASAGVANRVREWVRESGFTDKRKAPNHSFRHWFKSVAPKFGIPAEVADQIQGHVGAGVAAQYRHARLEVLYAAICKVQVPTQSD